MHAKIYDSLFEYGKCSSLVKNSIAVMSVLHFLQFIFAVICDDNLMRNGCMECFWSEAYWKVRRSDENTESTVYRKLARK